MNTGPESIVDLTEESKPEPPQTKVAFALTVGQTEDGKLFLKLHGSANIVEFLGLLSVADDLVKNQPEFKTIK